MHLAGLLRVGGPRFVNNFHGSNAGLIFGTGFRRLNRGRCCAETGLHYCAAVTSAITLARSGNSIAEAGAGHRSTSAAGAASTIAIACA